MVALGSCPQKVTVSAKPETSRPQPNTIGGEEKGIGPCACRTRNGGPTPEPETITKIIDIGMGIDRLGPDEKRTSRQKAEHRP